MDIYEIFTEKLFTKLHSGLRGPSPFVSATL